MGKEEGTRMEEREERRKSERRGHGALVVWGIDDLKPVGDLGHCTAVSSRNGFWGKAPANQSINQSIYIAQRHNVSNAL